MLREIVETRHPQSAIVFSDALQGLELGPWKRLERRERLPLVLVFLTRDVLNSVKLLERFPKQLEDLVKIALLDDKRRGQSDATWEDRQSHTSVQL